MYISGKHKVAPDCSGNRVGQASYSLPWPAEEKSLCECRRSSFSMMGLCNLRINYQPDFYHIDS